MCNTSYFHTRRKIHTVGCFLWAIIGINVLEWNIREKNVMKIHATVESSLSSTIFFSFWQFCTFWKVKNTHSRISTIKIDSNISKWRKKLPVSALSTQETRFRCPSVSPQWIIRCSCGFGYEVKFFPYRRTQRVMARYNLNQMVSSQLWLETISHFKKVSSQ